MFKDMMNTVDKLTMLPKGILAADESIGTIGKRFSNINVENNHINRKRYRQLLFTTKDLEQYISGVIVYEETLLDKNDNDEPLIKPLIDKNILVGIKVDKGLVPIPNGYNEKMTQGLDGLRERCNKYYNLGARFTKWRCIFEINPDNGFPTDLGIKRNSSILAQYAAISQECGLVPIVEPEVIMTNIKDIRLSEYVTRNVLSTVFNELIKNNVRLDLMLLKPNLVRFDSNDLTSEHIDDIAFRTLAVLQDTVPISVQGIMFLSGGLNEENSTIILNKINQMKTIKPWRLSFSFGRALQYSCLLKWKGNDDNILEAQKVLLSKAYNNGLASIGKYNDNKELEDDMK
jgi:fructose-bisphosphate aldolase class I